MASLQDHGHLIKVKTLFRVVLVFGCLFLVALLFLPLVYRDRRPPIFHAVERGDTNAIAQYLARGSNVNEPILTYHYGGKRLAPLLAVAAHCGQLEALQFLLRNGANPNQLDWEGKSSLFWAMGSDENRLEIFKALLTSGADPNLSASSEYRYTPLLEASSLGLTEIAKLLLTAGANPKATNAIGQTPLHLAENAEVAKLLITAGADRDVRDQSGMTPADTLAWLQQFNALAVLTNTPQTNR